MRRKRKDDETGGQVGDSLYLVYQAGSDLPDYCTNDYNAAVCAAKNHAEKNDRVYEVYAKIGQAVPVRPVKPSVTYRIVRVTGS